MFLFLACYRATLLPEEQFIHLCFTKLYVCRRAFYFLWNSIIIHLYSFPCVSPVVVVFSVDYIRH